MASQSRPQITCLERGWGSFCTPFHFPAQHRAGEGGSLRDQFSWGPCHIRGMPLHSGPLSQPAHPRGRQGHLHVSVLPQRVRGEVDARTEQRTPGFYRWTTYRGMKGITLKCCVFLKGASFQGKAELEELNEAGELRKVLAEYPVSW